MESTPRPEGAQDPIDDDALIVALIWGATLRRAALRAAAEMVACILCGHVDYQPKVGAVRFRDDSRIWTWGVCDLCMRFEDLPETRGGLERIVIEEAVRAAGRQQ